MFTLEDTFEVWKLIYEGDYQKAALKGMNILGEFILQKALEYSVIFWYQLAFDVELEFALF
jgi:hypothetical protein